jgi:hypothetical protein
MKQLLITIAVLATLTGKAFTQTKYTLQSIKQLHQKLKGAEGKDRVNILNELGYAWYRVIDTTILKKWKDKVVIKGDSVRFYGTSAYNEAKKINYKKGIATAASLVRRWKDAANSLAKGNALEQARSTIPGGLCSSARSRFGQVPATLLGHTEK